jgi:protoporphyrinogen IX oxidase
MPERDTRLPDGEGLMSYEWLKALHVIAVISWMAGMLYLPRLFVYHAGAKPGSELSETLKVMERKLLRIIINPAMIAAWLLGGAMLWQNPQLLHQPFMHMKLGLLVLMQITHAYLARCRRAFANDANRHPARLYRILNEIPAVLMIGIVIAIIIRPFS